MDRLWISFVVVLCYLVSCITCMSEKPTETAKLAIISETSPGDADATKEMEKRAGDWSGLKAAWGKRTPLQLDGIVSYDDLADVDGVGLVPFERDARADWKGLQSAWGKRADWKGLQSAWGKRASNWQGLQAAWGKRADWKGLQSAWGKRGGLNDEYIENIQRQMEAMKNRRSNWQSLASWGRRR
ncbi:prothoracicostatic peptides-like [Paramacrobiotus metropolitanus]|uniref:prothoracicostatic peptides-like n=1 Tax=Paramacrobiotus metropolitanus TaxID=2943436 RepID=UPI002445A82D|nr:prothoracicostatic peptides-like [Paramacrobiotus metropolitanus]